MKILNFVVFVIVFVLGAEIVETTVLFTRYNGPANWMTAKSNCETLGQRLAVLDTMEKRDALQEQGTSLSAGPWIGLHDPDENNQFVWLNGNALSNDDTHWSDGNPDTDEEYCGYIKSSGEWADYHCTATGAYICEKNLFCLKPISGIGGEKLVDGNTSTCLILEQPPQDVARIQASLSVNQTCRSGLNINLIARVNEATQCHELQSIIVGEKPGAGCSKLSKCQEISSLTEEGNRVCKMGCECADSANQCVIHVINEISSTNVDICEIDVI